MTELFDHRQVRRAFSRAAHGYDGAAALQREVGARLSEALDYLDDRAPAVVVDVGSGPGHAAVAMQKRWPRAQVIALDLALPMLGETRVHAGGGVLPRFLGGARRPDLVCADARALPLRDASVDVLYSNLCLQWVEDLPAVFAGFRRVLKPEGLLLVSTFGPDTLFELRSAFAQADNAPHVSPFASIAQFGDALIAAGFKNPVLDRDEFVLGHDDLGGLMRELRTLGATNAMSDRRRSLTGRARFARAAQAYEGLRAADGRLPATWEVIYAQAWGPAPGTPIRSGGIDEVQVPLSSIPIRRRP
ncbi:malonyl-ACP O-methyltransferase BioC [Lysobacter silvisoli]|uniref:Malonyl-[acyl-carrier protein] O-methyltransferase n=1 Tax=Lysobacter silvisoli TaxID=2293254 RepID=A0A371JXV8_9GAMM|nr:malonyl-ACP O-methyltransferase BioC [Lysobacter silvisoli]RDZ26480.1 malonyl-[acyl-carrier protein] O-methyltransferase BioC [Lysobacter silvisoli]